MTLEMEVSINDKNKAYEVVALQ